MSRIWVQLARTGDILNILPMLWADAQAGLAPELMVQKDYAPLLEGVSYVKPIIWEGGAHEIALAMEQAKALSNDVVCTMVNGPLPEVEEHVYKRAGLTQSRTTSFQKEQWRVANRLAEWDKNYPLVFDRRDKGREHALAERVLKKLKKPPVLVAADGISSPFPYKDLLLELLEHCGFPVVNLATVQAERFYDLIDLYERAVALVAIDSAPLHLARAVPSLPVLALANDRPILWHGSIWRGQYEWYSRYHDFPEKAVEMLRVLRALPAREQNPQIVHLWNATNGTIPRLPATGWRLTPIERGMCPRLGPLDKPETVYLRDCIRMALQRTGESQWMVLTRPDTRFEEPAVLTQNIACYAYRVQEGQAAPIADMFCASGSWWRANLPKIPDLLYGKDHFWSHVLWAIFKEGGAVDVTGAVCRPAAEANRAARLSAAATFNRELCEKFVGANHVFSRYPKVSEQVETIPLERRDLKPFGYNPAIIEEDGWLTMAYRWHHKGTLATALMLAQVDETGKVISNRPLEIDAESAEDPKFFRVGGLLRVSYVAATWPKAARAAVRYGLIANGKMMAVVKPQIGQNDGTGLEKNWVFWEQDGSLFCIYKTHPVQQVFRLEGEEASQPLETPGPAWFWGPAKGGTPPVEFDGAWLRFFHSTLDNEQAPNRRRYYVGAYLMEKEPPFKVLRVSKRPIIYGSEIDDLKVKDRPFHWKANVVFISGIIARKDHFVVSLGINDSQCLLAKTYPESLNL